MSTKNCWINSFYQKESSSSYERTVKDYLNNSLHLETLHENECNLKPINPKTGYLLRYDNEVVDYKLIIEVHGIQHYTSDIPERWADGKDKQKLFEELSTWSQKEYQVLQYEFINQQNQFFCVWLPCR